MMHFLLIFFLSFSASADPWKNLKQGDQTAQALLGQMDQKKKEADPHPFYKGTPNESKLSHKQLEETSKNAARQNAASQMVRESYDGRPKMIIDPQKDPLLIGSQKILENPLEVIGGKGTQAVEVQQGGRDETLVCEEAGDDSL